MRQEKKTPLPPPNLHKPTPKPKKTKIKKKKKKKKQARAGDVLSVVRTVVLMKIWVGLPEPTYCHKLSSSRGTTKDTDLNRCSEDTFVEAKHSSI